MRLPPLSDLHRHLDGSLREATLRELAAELGVEVPDEFRFSPGMGLSAALRCFELSLAVLQAPAAVRRVADEICADAAREGVTTLEIRFAPQLHEGASPAAIVDAAAEGVAGRAGLILCGLFGEDPTVLEAHVGVARSRPAVVGIDLAGGPSPHTRILSATTPVPSRSPATSAWAAPCTPGRGGRRPRSAKRSFSCTRNASATARPCWTMRRWSSSFASGV